MKRDTTKHRPPAIQTAAGVVAACNIDHEHAGTCQLYGFHDLKRSCGSFNASLPEAVLQQFMRHVSAATTRTYYQNRTHLLHGIEDKMYVPEVDFDES